MPCLLKFVLKFSVFSRTLGNISVNLLGESVLFSPAGPEGTLLRVGQGPRVASLAEKPQEWVFH